jgi:hypothetical protein
MDKEQDSLDTTPTPAQATVEEARLITRRAHLRAALLSVPVVLTLTSNASAQGVSGYVETTPAPPGPGGPGLGGRARAKGRRGQDAGASEGHSIGEFGGSARAKGRRELSDN